MGRPPGSILLLLLLLAHDILGTHSVKGDRVKSDVCDFEPGSCAGWTDMDCNKGYPCWKAVKADEVSDGPVSDHSTGTGGGKYGRATFPAGQRASNTAVMEREAKGPFCFTAWLHISALKLPTVTFSAVDLPYFKFLSEERSFFSGRMSEHRLWQKVVYEEDRHRNIKIKIQSSYTDGAVAVDDISIRAGKCPKPPRDGSCTFDTSTCDYTNHQSSGPHKWVRSFPWYRRPQNWPSQDHTTGTAGGGYAVFETPYRQTSSGILTSQVLSKPERPRQCLRFFYFVPDASMSRGLLVRLIRNLQPASMTQRNGAAAQDNETLWHQNAALLPKRWTPVEVSYTVRDNYELHFQCYSNTNRNPEFFCAIDDVEVFPCDDKKGEKMSCSFDDGHLCKWQTSSDAGDVLWELSDVENGVPQLPRQDHTLSTPQGKFIYVENKENSTVVKAKLLSPALDPKWVGAACISFWHFAVLEDPRNCNLTVLSANESEWWSGSHQLKRSWSQEVVRLWLQEGRGTVSIEASLGTALIALDDIVLTYGQCDSERRGLSCDFEHGPCTWTNALSKRRSSEWFVRGGRLRSSLPRPATDHTLGTSQGSYAFVSGARPYSAQSATLVSEVVNLKVPGVQCMDFWFIVQNVAGTQLSVLMEKNGQNGFYTHVVWAARPSNLSEWRRGQVKVPRGARVMLDGKVANNIKSYIAVDDISIGVNSNCRSLPRDAAAGNEAYVRLDCSWSEPRLCPWWTVSSFDVLKKSSTTPPEYFLAPTSGPEGHRGSFLYTGCDSRSSPKRMTAFLQTQLVHPAKDPVCLRFSLHAFYGIDWQVKLSQAIGTKENLLFLSTGRTTADRWYRVARTVSFNTPAASKLVFTFNNAFCKSGGVALGDIHATPGPCSSIDGDKGLCDFESGTCNWRALGAWKRAHVTSDKRLWDASMLSGPPFLGHCLLLYKTTSTSASGSLASPTWSAHHQPRLLEFLYLRDQSRSSSLSVELQSPSGTSTGTIWRLPTTAPGLTWNLARIEIPPQKTDFKITIQGTTGHASHYWSLLAVENVRLSTRPGSHVANCNFEGDLCGYINVVGSDPRLRWLVGSGRVREPSLKPFVPALPLVGLSEGLQASKTFAYVDTTVPLQSRSKNSSATLSSAVFTARENDTLLLRYFRKGNATESFMVYQSKWIQDETKIAWVPLGSLQDGDDWQDFEAPLQAATESQIHVMITRSSNQLGFAAVASISVGHARSVVPKKPEQTVDCNFENATFCNWKPESTRGSQLEWKLNDPRNRQPVFPSFDSTTQTYKGQYMYAERSKTVGTEAARLKSPALSTEWLKSMCFSFWYFGLADANSSLSVSLSSASDVAWHSSVSQLTAWTHGQTQFAESAPQEGTTIILEASIQVGLVAVDDLSATPGPCPATPLCSFEGAMDCGLEPDIDNVRDWTVVNGSDLGVRDHTTDSTAGHFLYLNTTYVEQKLHSFGRIFLPERGATDATCLTFWWRAVGADSVFNVYNYRQGVGLRDPVLSFVTRENPWWNARSVTLSSEKTWQAVFEVLLPEMTLQESSVFLDDIELTSGFCHPENYCSFESPRCLHWKNSDKDVTNRWSLERAGLSVITRDHTLKSQEGHYLLFRGDRPRQRASLVLTDQRYHCATMWHYISEAPENLTIMAGGLRLANSTGGQWKEAMFSVDIKNAAVSAISGGRSDAFAAIDDLLLIEERCSRQRNPAPPPFVCAVSGLKVPAEARCNFIADCSDGSDEVDCGACSFENGTCGWSVEGHGLLRSDDFSWQRQKAATAVGPLRDHTTSSSRGHYLLLRAKKPIDSMTVIGEASSPILHNTGHLCVVKFWFNYRASNDTHVFLLELLVNGFGIVAWDSWELAENPSEGKWNEGQFLLGRYRSPLQIYLRGYESPTNDSYTAIDDISFEGCDMPVPSAEQNLGMFTCKNKVSIVMEHLCDYTDHCGDFSDEEECDDFKFRCNFDSSFCDWTPEVSTRGGWTRSKPFQYLTRGPTRDHTSGGKAGSFLYLKSEAKSVSASLLGPVFNATTLCVMRFYFAMKASTSAALSVKTRNTANGEFKEVWRIDQPTEFRHFTEAFVAFNESSDFQVSIEGSLEGGRDVQGYIAVDDVTFLDSCHAASDTLPSSPPETSTPAPANCTHGDFACLSGDLCIPAIQLCDFHKQCPDGSDESHCGACDFSTDLCGLEASRSQGQPRWSRVPALMVASNRARFPSLPREDSGHSERGFYVAYLKTDAAVPTSLNTALMTPPLGAMGHACRLTFYSFLPKQTPALKISVAVVERSRDQNPKLTKKSVLLARGYEDQAAWKMQAANIGNRRSGARIYYSGGENVSIDDIEYHHCHPDDSSEDSVNCTFEEKDGCGWYPENVADSGDWKVISGAPIFAVPDHTTGHGMYLALGNRAETTVVAHVVSTRLNATGEAGRCFRMWYHMQGDRYSRLNLRLFNVSNADSNFWTRSGHQGATWMEAAINIKVTDAPFQLLLEGELPSYSPSFIGVDDISFDERPCPPTLTCDFEEGPCDWTLEGWKLDTGGGFKAVPTDHTTGTSTGNFARLEGRKGRILSAKHDLSMAERRCFRFWHFFTGQREQTLSVYKCTTEPAETPELVWTIHGEDRPPQQWLSGSVNVAVNDSSSLRLEMQGENPEGNVSALAVDDLLLSGWACPRPGSCSFEDDLCDWRNVAGSSDLVWQRWSGPTPDRNGPAIDHTLGSRHGHFLFLDAQQARDNRVGVIESELLHYFPKSCLQFYYFVDPKGSQATLSVQYARRGKVFRRIRVLAERRPAGWQLFRSLQSWLPAAYNIRISGYPGHDKPVDVAIDDIEVFDRDCPGNVLPGNTTDLAVETRNSTVWDCDFDMDLCSWNQSGNTWIIRSGRTAILTGDGPHTDSKLRSLDGKYAYFSPHPSSPSHVLTSAPLLPSESDYCVQFWYFLYSLAPTQLRIGIFNGASSGVDKLSWTQQRGFDRIWRRGSFIVPSWDAAGKRLAVEVQQRDRGLAEVALDQMRVAPSGTCAHPAGSLCDFEGDGYCGFLVDSSGGGRWRVAGGNSDPVTLSGQYNDHTFGASQGGHFLLLHLSEQKRKQDAPYVASLVLPDQAPMQERCLTLWFFVEGTGVAQLNISVRARGSSGSVLQDMLFGVPSTGWRYGSATVQSASWHEVLLTAEVEQGGTVAVGLDDISLSDGACPEQGHCDFEGPDMCGWENAETGVQRMWARNRGSTPHSLLGPRADHTLGTPDGTYVYLDGRNSTDEGTYTGILKSQYWSGSSPYCLSFWLYMREPVTGPGTSSLRVTIAYGDRENEKRDALAVFTGSQGKQWRRKRVTLKTPASAFAGFRVLLAGTAGGPRGGDIAVDDVEVIQGACDPNLEVDKFKCHDGITFVNISQVCDFKKDCPGSGDDEQLCGQCDFDVDTCGWYSKDDWKWTIAKDAEHNSSLPVKDHSRGDERGGYVYSSAHGFLAEAGKVLHSPNGTHRLKHSGRDCTMSFWYFASGRSSHLSVHKYTLGYDATVWLVESDGPQVWTKGRARIGRSQSEFGLAFEASSGLPVAVTFIAIDTISFEKCALPAPSPQNCSESNRFLCPETNVCISKKLLCDHVDDCGDGSDEVLDMCQNYSSCTYEPRSDPCTWRAVNAEPQRKSLEWRVSSVPYQKGRHVNTGPYTDHTIGGLGAGRVLLLRPLQRGDLNSSAFYRSPNYITSNEECSLTFHYYLHGKDVGGIALFAQYQNYTEKSQWENLFVVKGQRGQHWNLARAVVHADKPFCFVIEGSLGGGYASDVAIDDISVSPGCISYNNTLPNPALPPMPKCKPSQYACRNGDCIPNQLVCDFEEDCADGSDEEMCGPCSFENGPCGWTDVSSGEVTWQVTLARYLEEPKIDHTTQTAAGHLLALNNNGNFANTAAVLSPELPPSSSRCSMSFWYYYPSIFDAVKMDVRYILPQNNSAMLVEVTPANSWTRLVVNVPRRETREGRIAFRANAAKLHRMRSIGIDDISFMNCRPSSLFIDCSFDDKANNNGFCHWQNTGNSSDGWQVKFPGPNHDGVGPTADHTSGRGGYAIFSAEDATRTTSLESAETRPSANNVSCLTFWYTMNNGNALSLVIEAKTMKNSSVKFTRKNAERAGWNFGELPVSLQEPYIVTISAVQAKKAAAGAFIAMDDIVLTDGPCRRTGFCDFESDFCDWKLAKEGLSDGWRRISPAKQTAAVAAHDHTLGTSGGHYALVIPKRQGDKATLSSPVFENTGNRCLRYWFNMAGDSTGTLSVYQWLNGSSRVEDLKPAWKRSGDQNGAWRRGHVKLRNMRRFQIVIEAFAEATNAEGSSYIALDDVEFSLEPCEDTVTCNFETDACGWLTDRTSSKLPWIRTTGSAGVNLGGPGVDVTTSSSYGSYMLAEFGNKSERNEIVLLSDYADVQRQSSYCFSLWYIFRNESESSILVKSVKDGDTRTSETLVNLTERKTWTKQAITLLTGEEAQRSFQIVALPGRKSDPSALSGVAVDEVEFFYGSCDGSTKAPVTNKTALRYPPHPLDCDFEDDNCAWTNGSTNSRSVWVRRLTEGRGDVKLVLPETDHTTKSVYGSFAYLDLTSTEGSQGPFEEDNAILESDFPLHVGGDGACLKFWFFAFGSDVAPLVLQERDAITRASRVAWTNAWSRGPQWNYAQVHLEGEKAVFLGFESSKTPGGHMALDDITANTGQCPTPPYCDFETDDCGWRLRDGAEQLRWERMNAWSTTGGRDHTMGSADGHVLAVNASSSKAYKGTTVTIFSRTQEAGSSSCVRFWYQLSSGQKLSLGTTEGATQRLEAVFTKSALILSGGWHPAQVNIKSTPAKPFEYYLRVTLDAEGGIAAVDDIQILNACPNLGSCDFEEDFCNWENVPTSPGSALWDRFTGRSHMFGPDVDHTFNESFGAYAAIGSNATSTDVPAHLVSPILSDCNDICFSFWSYHVGTLPHMLSLFLRTEFGDDAIEYSFTADVNARWVKAQANISASATECRLGFSMVFPPLQSSVLALDDLVVSGGPCEPLEDINHPEFSCDNETKHLTRDRVCNFEVDCSDGKDEDNCGTECDFESKGTCYWKRTNEGALWSLEQPKNSSMREPTEDHTTRSAEGSFLRFKIQPAQQHEPTASFFSPNLIDASPTCTLGFWYYSTVLQQSTVIRVVYGLVSKLKLLDTTALVLSGHNGTLGRKKWRYAAARIGRVSERFSVKFLGKLESFDETFLIDDLSFSGCNRKSVAWKPIPCPPNFFTCANGNCISKSTVCDFNDDCGDMSDEGLSPRANCTSFPARCDLEGGACDWKMQSPAWELRLRRIQEYGLTNDDLRDHTTNSVYGNFLRFLFADQSLKKGELSSPILSTARGARCFLRFFYAYQTKFSHLDYRLYSMSAGSLAVYVRLDLLGERHLVWKTSRVFGQHYERKVIPLDNFRGPMQIVIEASAGKDANGAWAVDDLSFTDGCTLSSVTTLPVLKPEATTESPSRLCSSAEFACPDKSCIPLSKVCNFIKDCKGGADEAACASCNFDSGTCGWQDVSVGRYSWRRLQGGQDERDPSADVSGKGFFMGVTKGEGVVLDAAVLKSVQHGASVASCSLEMFYYVGNVVPGTDVLRLSVLERNSSSETPLLALRSFEIEKWKKVTVEIGRKAYGGWALKLSATPPTPQSRIAVDDISLRGCGKSSVLGSDCQSKGQFSCKGSQDICYQKSQLCDWSLDCPDGSDELNCSTFPERCNFENGICGWTDGVVEGQSRWSVVSGDALADDDEGPNFDHTFGNTSGHYLILKKESSRKSHATLKSVTFKGTTTRECRMRYWYMIADYAELEVIIMPEAREHDFHKIKILSGNTTIKEWQKTDLILSSAEDFQVVLNGWPDGYIAIDDVSFTPSCLVSHSSVVPTLSPAGTCKSETEFTCRDNSCILKELVCDFKPDCPFGSDESQCPSSCNFEQGECGWNSPNLSESIAWRSITAMEAREQVQNSPTVDVTKNSSSGSYLSFYVSHDGVKIDSPIKMFSQPFQQSTPDCKINFYHWLTIPVIHVRLLIVSDDSEEILLWERTSKKLAKSWIFQSVGVGRRKGHFRLAFEVDSSSSGGGLHFALDEINFVDCGYPKNNQLYGDPCEQKDSFKCKLRQFCISSEKKCDLYDDCGDGSDEEDCTNQRVTFDDEKTGVLEVGNLKRDHTEGSLHFQRGRSPSRKEDDTGPVFDHTTFNKSGAYVQFGGAYHGFNKMATLSSLTLQSGSCSVTFHSYMFGRQVNLLSIYLRYFNNSNDAKEVWHQEGPAGDFWQRHRVDVSDTRNRQLVFAVRSGKGPKDVIALDDISFSRECRFSTKNLPDDPSAVSTSTPAAPEHGRCDQQQFACVSDGLCVSSDRVCDFRNDCADGSDEMDCVQPTCDFENGNLCGWAVTRNASLLAPASGTTRFTTYSLENEFGWKLIQANDQSDRANRALRPRIDHSEGTQQGWYALASSAYGGTADASLLYSSRLLSRTAGGCRLQAWYYCTDDCTLQLLRYASAEGTVQERPLWTAFRAPPKEWTLVHVPVGILRGARLAWRAQRGYNQKAVQALDDLKFLSCEPPALRNATCPSDMFRCALDNWCIERSQLCDQTWDCEDGSDETTMACKSVRSRCSFEDAHCEDWVNDAKRGVHLRWSRRIAGEADLNLPLTDHTTSSGQGAYMAVYKRWAGTAGVTTSRRLSSFVISTNPKLACQVRFWYNMPKRGVSLEVYRQTSLGDDGLSRVLTVPVTGSDYWNRVDINFGTAKEIFRVVIQAVFTDSGARQGVAIDDITMTDGCRRSDRELPGNDTKNETTPSGQCGSERLQCKDGGCYSPLQRCNFISDCKDATDERDCGASCDFEEDFCGWYSSLSVEERWYRMLGDRGDHTLGTNKGHYLNSGIGVPRPSGARAQLHSKIFRESGPECSLSFWYYSPEKISIGFLNVYIKQAKASPKIDQVFSLAEKEMAQNRWELVKILLGRRVEFGVIVEAVWGSTDRAALHLDDFLYQKCRPDHHASSCTDTEWMCADLTQCIAHFERCDGKRDCSDGSDERDCVHGFGDCSFDEEDWAAACNWTVENVAGQPSWKRAKESHSEDTGPPSSHRGTPETYFLLANSTELPMGAVSIARTPQFPASQDKCHLRFWYFMKGSSSMEFLRVETEGAGSRLPMWQELGNQGPLWAYAHVMVSHPKPFTVNFLAQRGGDTLTDIAIDEVTFTPSCLEGGATDPKKHSSLCVEDEFLCADRKMCIPRSFVCDCESDCEDGSDETDCGVKCKGGVTTASGKATGRPLTPANGTLPTTPTPACAPKEYGCGSHNDICIPALLLCDGIPDCPNGEDERQCDFKEGCPDGYYYCRNPHSCLHQSKLCDGRADCSDGSDESICNVCPDYFCLNGGDCSLSRQTRAPSCFCRDVFGGNRCARELTVQPPYAVAQTRVSGVAGWAYGAPLVVIFVVAAAVVAAVYWRKRRALSGEEAAPVTISNPSYGLYLDDANIPNLDTEGDTSSSAVNPLYSDC